MKYNKTFAELAWY